MSMDLTLLIVEDHPALPANHARMAHTLLAFASNAYDLFDAILAVSEELPFPVSSHFGREVPDGKCAGERTWGDLTSDPYGTAPVYVTARDFLAAVTPLCQFDFRLRPSQIAACAYIAALPSETKIVLYFS